MRRPLSSRHPLLYWFRVRQRRLFKHILWLFSKHVYSVECRPEHPLPFRYTKHTSKLVRKLGESDIALQYNKIINLKIAVRKINGIIIRPGEYFSFCKLVGKPTRNQGYVEGMELSFGEARRGIGGGICQLSNLIHWMALHSPLRVVERANHSFDPFPDHNRVLPFGSGAAIFYNFIDLVLHNPTTDSFQIVCVVGDRQLEGLLLCDRESAVKYHVYQKSHRFVREEGYTYRENTIWRDTITKGHHPQIIESIHLYSNRVIVKYDVGHALLCQQDTAASTAINES